jgi:3-hydroxyacyl-CoA dehydrogenase/enoyl-CoA hydratase/3-hydroxybutyryl-CoA epimerase/3-hydroxyacyl-CoA dehydrogenase/enoyl-CoA hydratase/3-hydroxybutyryl-CoA epimerase/enoyl-CoA isomerase
MVAGSTITLKMPEADIAVLTLDMPGKGANVLSSPVMKELDAHLGELEKRDDLAGLVFVSGKTGTFIAGADIREFVQSLGMGSKQTAEMCQKGQNLFRRLSQCPFVTVAAIDGVCVGGGAELAAWCDRRIMSDNPKTEFGFPEVKLGIFPGWGGTVRAPRIVGIGNAVEMITSGESIDSRTALAMGWISDIVPQNELIEAAINLIRADQATGQYLKDRHQWNRPIQMAEAELGFLGATATAYIQQQTKGQYPAPLAALEVLLGGAGADVDEACQMEAQGVARLFGSPINAALINVFFLTDRNKKDTGIDREGITPRKVAAVGVVGAGIMGAGIAAANVKRDVPVALTDASPAALEQGVRNVMNEVSYNRSTKRADVERAVQYAPFLNATRSDAELATCDLVIEAATENADVKRKIFARLEPQLRSDAILASNTSTIPIAKLAEGLQRPEQFCGIHFFNPVRNMKLVEIIRGRQTSDQTVATAVAYAKQLGKFPIVVNDGPGFLVNRLLFPYMNESLELLGEGVAIQDIERAATRFGMPMGPIALYDMVGLDTAMYAGQIMLAAFPDRIKASPILPALVKAGRLGPKSGRGFFSYENRKKRAEPDPEVKRYIEPYVRMSAQMLTQDELTSRLFLPMLLEATRVLQEKIVRDVRDVDLGLIFGIGFPPFRGGLLFWADTLGAKSIVEMLKPLERLGKRTQPTPLLKEMAETGRKFYG